MSDPTATNPLLDLGFPIPFDRIRAEHVEPGLRALVAEARARLAALVADTRPRTFETTLGALEAATEPLELAVELVEHLEGVATTPELRAAWSAVQPEASSFFSGIALDAGLWAAIKAYAATDEARALTGERRRFLDKVVADFRRSGADLDAAGKERLRAIDVELAQLTLRYGQNDLDSTNAFDVVVDDPARLAGLPPSEIAAAGERAAQKGVEGYRLTLQMPSYLPAMTYLDDASLREALYRGNATRATEGEHDNRGLVRRILELRREKATLLGYSDFADLVCEDRMAKTGKAARAFVEELQRRAAPHFERENAELHAFRREIEGPGAPGLAPWDVAYYAEKLRRARYDFDEEELRPYFSLERVLEGAFSVASRLYGVRIEPWEGAPVWHTDVRAFRVAEEGGGSGACFYVDVFPREEKRGGAWMHGLISATGARAHGPHLEILAGNFSPPVAGAPALLRHREVETLFHEFGHLMHHASSEVRIRSLAGTNVARDFVELPSQIMENWCWEREALDLFALHHETGAPIPDETFRRMRAARSFRAANAMIRQLGFAEVDLALHTDWDPKKDPDVVAYARAILDRSSPARLPADHAMICGFSHLFASPVGYAAGYYSYKWAEVLDADAFTRFLDAGIFSRDIGRSFRQTILARGDSEDPAELYRRFMGREPRLEALLAREGLVAPPPDV